MAAPILRVNPNHPQLRTVERAASALAAAGVIAYPTDTQYGIGCDLFSKKAIDRLYALKGLDRKKPLALLCPDLSQVAQYARVSNFAYRTMRHLAPGPFTFILEATRLVPEMMTTQQKHVGIRVPAMPLVIALSRALGRPLVNSSAANGEGAPLVEARQIKDELGHGLELVLDGGIQVGEPSTVVSLVDDEIRVLRQGKGIIPRLVG